MSQKTSVLTVSFKSGLWSAYVIDAKEAGKFAADFANGIDPLRLPRPDSNAVSRASIVKVTVAPYAPKPS